MNTLGEVTLGSTQWEIPATDPMERVTEYIWQCGNVKEIRKIPIVVEDV